MKQSNRLRFTEYAVGPKLRKKSFEVRFAGSIVQVRLQKTQDGGSLLATSLFEPQVADVEQHVPEFANVGCGKAAKILERLLGTVAIELHVGEVAPQRFHRPMERCWRSSSRSIRDTKARS